MDDRELVLRLIELGVAAFQKGRRSYADPSIDANMHEVGAATIATWLEELGRYRLIGDVQPNFSRAGTGFRYQVTEKAVHIWSNQSTLEQLLDQIAPIPPKYDVFISYASGDSALAIELKSDLEHQGLTCFMAEKDIPVAKEWQDSIRAALLGSRRLLILLTPRSLNRPWVFMETGAAWALGKESFQHSSKWLIATSLTRSAVIRHGSSKQRGREKHLSENLLTPNKVVDPAGATNASSLLKSHSLIICGSLQLLGAIHQPSRGMFGVRVHVELNMHPYPEHRPSPSAQLRFRGLESGTRPVGDAVAQTA